MQDVHIVQLWKQTASACNSNGEKLVAIMLIFHSFSSDDGCAHVTLQQLIEETGLSRGYVLRCLRELCKRGLFEFLGRSQQFNYALVYRPDVVRIDGEQDDEPVQPQSQRVDRAPSGMKCYVVAPYEHAITIGGYPVVDAGFEF